MKQTLQREAVEEIRAKFKTGKYTHKILAQEYGVKYKVIQQILDFTTYRFEDSVPSSIPPGSKNNNL